MIMDPGIDGLETYRRVLEINPKQKAIIVSGFSETDRVRRPRSWGPGPMSRSLTSGRRWLGDQEGIRQVTN